MKIVTCLTEVPGRETRYEILAEGTWIREADLSYEINECDEYALEESLRLQEKHGGEVTILTLGKGRAERSIRKGLAMGADRAILIRDEAGKAASPLPVAAALAGVLKERPFDLILAGTQSDHYSFAQTGVMLAELLNLPHATIVMQIEAQPEEGRIRALREMESGWFEWVELPLPALLTIQAGITQVRFPSLRGIMQAKKKELVRLELDDLELPLESLPGLQIERLYFPESARKAEILKGDPETVAARLVEKLRKEAKVL